MMHRAPSDQERHDASMVSPDLTGRTRHGRKAEDVDAFSSHERKEGYSPKTGSSLSRGAQFGKARVVDLE